LPIPVGAQQVGRFGRGARLLHRKLGIAMQVVVEGSQLRPNRIEPTKNLVQSIHDEVSGCGLICITRRGLFVKLEGGAALMRNVRGLSSSGSV